MALDYRQTFGKDVVVDIVCYRKLGHNEQDEPMVTQPLMYSRVAKHPGARHLYAQRLISEEVIAEGDEQAMIDKYRDDMDSGKLTDMPVLSDFSRDNAVDWTPFINRPYTFNAKTTVAVMTSRPCLSA